MKSMLSKIAAPLLVGSILALGALALPVKADAGDQRFAFRLKNTVATQVVDKGGEEGSGQDAGSVSGPKSWLVLSFAGGYSIECETAWTADFVAAHPKPFRSASLSLVHPYAYAYTGWHSLDSIPDGKGDWYRALSITPAPGGGISSDPWLAEYGQPCVQGTADLVGPFPPVGTDHRFTKVAVEVR